MAEYAVMPKEDYQDACDAVREKTGGTEAITSGEMGAQIRAIQTGGDDFEITDASYLFYGGAREDIMDALLSKIKHPTKVENMFCNFTVYEEGSTNSLRDVDIDLSWMDFSGVENCEFFFSGATSVTLIDLTGVDFSNVKNMTRMFYDSRVKCILGHENWDVSNVTDMSLMFGDATAGNNFSGTLDISRWDTSKVQNFSSFLNGFYNTSRPRVREIIGLETLKTGACTKFDSMFKKADIARLDLSKWDMSQASSVTSMFSGASALSEVLNFLGNNAKAYLSLASTFPAGSSASSTTMLRRLTFAPTCTTGGFTGFSLKYCRFGRGDMVELFNSLPVCTDTTGNRNTITITGNPCVSDTYKPSAWIWVLVDDYDDFLAKADDFYGSLDRTTAKVSLTKKSGGANPLVNFVDVDEALFNEYEVVMVDFEEFTATVPESDRLTDEDRAIATAKGWALVE